MPNPRILALHKDWASIGPEGIYGWRQSTKPRRAGFGARGAHAFAAARVPVSGAVGGCFGGDLARRLFGRDLCMELKVRADGFRELYCWLNQRDVLIVKSDRQDPLVILRLSLAAEIAKAAA